MRGPALNSSSFDKKLYDKLKTIVHIKKQMIELKNDFIETIGDEILKNTEMINSKNGIMILCRCFIDIVSFYPKTLNNLIDLFIYLHSKSSSTNCLNYLHHYITTCIIFRENIRLSALLFLRKLFLQEIISYNSIISMLNKLPPHHQEIKQIDLIDDDDINDEISPQGEIDIENENIEGKLIEKLTIYSYANLKKLKVILFFYPEILKQYHKFQINHILHFKNNEIPYCYKIFVENLNNGYSPDPIARMIRKDDIDSFSLVCSQFTQPSDFDKTFTKTASFDRYSILSHKPNYIQYAAFFNSVKIFKYLLLNKADINAINNKEYSLAHFAVAGGSIEIIHILAQNHFPMVSTIPIAIEYYQNDILSYLIDNYFPKSEEDFDLMDYKHLRIKSKDAYLDPDRSDFSFDIENYDNFDYVYKKNDPKIVQVPIENEKDEEEELNNDDNFKYFNFDIIFHTIVESNNFLALFILFDYGMDINAKDPISKRTILHFAIQKGKKFLVHLLLSNKYIDLSIKDANDEKAIVYSLKYGKEDIFFLMMNEDKVKNSLDHIDYIKLAQYSKICGLKRAKQYLKENWKFSLVDMIDSYQIREFADIVYAAPYSFIKDQLIPALEKSFVTSNYHLLAMLVNRRSNLQKLYFYFKPVQDYQSVPNDSKVYHLFSLYHYDPYNRSFYQQYTRNIQLGKNYVFTCFFGYSPDGDPEYDDENYPYLFFPLRDNKQDPHMSLKRDWPRW